MLIDKRVVNFTDHQAVVPLPRSASSLSLGVVHVGSEVQVFCAEFHHRSGDSAAMYMVDAFSRQRDVPLY